MDRWLYASRSVRGRPDRMERLLRAATAELLSGEPAPERGADGSTVVTLPSRLAGVEMSKRVRVRPGVAYRRLGALRIPLRWSAEPLRMAFPSFEGYLEFEESDPEFGQLTLVGRYRPPLGAVGAVVDTVALGTAAQLTADVLLDRVCQGLVDHPDTTAEAPATTATGPQLLVHDVMTPDPVTFDPDMDLPTAARLLLHFGISGAPVVSEDGELIGVLSESDLMAKESAEPAGAPSGHERRRRALTVREACTRTVRTTHPSATLREAARDMLEHGVSRLVVIDDSRVAGIVTRHDVLAALVRGDAEIAKHAATVIAGVADDRVICDVEWGLIRLSGSVPTRAHEAALIERLQAVDGVTGVHLEPGWRVLELASPTGGAPRRSRS